MLAVIASFWLHAHQYGRDKNQFLKISVDEVIDIGGDVALSSSMFSFADNSKASS
ncbi:MAG: hypothetical protein IPP69_13325 [Flavobacteriales bacterium]|nr:hypothetical protein [Flavobacteriales bacterium]